MSTSEKLLMQIFERKRSIIYKFKHQIDLFDQELVSTLLIEGITPPSWLIGYNSSDSSTSTDPRELRKEELISKLLLPQQLPVFPYSNAPLYDNKVITARNLEASSDGFFRKTNSWNQNGDARDGISVMPAIDINDIGWSQDVLHQFDPTVVSPKDQMVSLSVDIDTDIDPSLVRFNRSRSRQQAFELRSSAKAVAESSLRDGKCSITCSSGNGGSMIASLQLKSVDELKMVKAAELKIENDGGREATIDEFESEEQHLDISKTTVSCGYLKLSEQRDNSLKKERAFDVDDVHVIVSGSGDQSVPCQNQSSNFSKKEANSSSFCKITRSRSFSPKPLHVQGSEIAKPSDMNFEDVEIAEPNVGECLRKDVHSLDDKHNTEDLTIIERSILERRSFLNDGSAGSSAERFVDTSKQQRTDNCGVTPLEPKEAVPAVSSSMLVERSGDCAVESTGILIHHVDELANENTENVTCEGRSICEMKSLSKKDDSAASSDRRRFDMDEKRLQNCGVTTLESKQALSCLSAASNFPKQDVSGSQGCLIEGIAEENTSTMMLDRGEECTVEGTCISLHHMDEVANENTGNVTLMERSTRERRSFLEEDDPAGSSDRRCSDMNEERVDNCGVSPMEPKRAVSYLSAVSNLHEHDVAGSQGCLIEGTAEENTSMMMLDRGEECTVEGTCISLHHMDEVANENTGNVTLMERSTRERRSFLEKDDPAGSSDRRFSDMNEERVDNCGVSSMEPKQAVSCLSAVSNLHEQDVAGSQGCLIEGTVMDNRSNMMLDQSEECTAEGTCISLHHMDKVANENTGNVTSMERSTRERRSFLEEDDPAGSSDRRCSDMNEERKDNCGVSPMEAKQAVSCLSAVSNVHEQDVAGSQGCLTEGTFMENGSSMMLDKSEECTVEGTYTVLHHVDELHNENLENLTSIGRNILGRKYFLKEESSAGSVDKRYFDMTDSNQTMPVYERFILDSGESQLGIAEGGIDFKELPLSDSSLERASFLEQLCKSAILNTPMSQFSTAHSIQEPLDLYQSVPNGLLEHMNFKNTSPPCENDGQQLDSSYLEDDLVSGFQIRSYSDGPLYTRDTLGRNARKPFASPVRKLWERRTSNSDSLKKQRNLNPELTCFTIEEDSIICEDSVSVICEEAGKIDEATATAQEKPGSGVMDKSIIRKPLADIVENSGNTLASFSSAQKSYDRVSLDSVSAEVLVTFSQQNVKRKPGNRFSGKRWGASVAKENKTLSMEGDVTRDAELLQNRFSKPKFSDKSRSKRAGPNIAQREPKRNNIVSNINSFVPLVQQRQAAAVVTGKRDIKVKALEAAEAAKRLAEKKENERKMKKDLRQLDFKKKQEDQKKKEIEVETRKRVREEEERKEKENKRKRVEETRKLPREQEKKLREKNEKETRYRPTADRLHEKKEQKNGLEKSKKIDMEVDENNFRGQLESEARLNKVLASDDTGERRVPTDHIGLNDHMLTVMVNVDRKVDNENLETKINWEKSYEISPYQGSDDEDDDDDIRRNKFVPHWASKNNLAQAVASQQHIKADVIFPPSFSANVAEDLVPRKR